MSFALPAILPLIGAATPAARAADVTGNYAGKPFDTSADGNSILGGSLNASFTFNGPLAANLTAADLSADIVSWTIGDSYGIFSYTSGEAQVTLVDAGFSTDANGNIIANYFETPESIEVDSDAPVGCDASGNNCGGQIVCVGSTCMSVNDWLPLATNPPVDLDVFRLIITSNITGFYSNVTGGARGRYPRGRPSWCLLRIFLPWCLDGSPLNPALSLCSALACSASLSWRGSLDFFGKGHHRA